jgi:hypothetical protein
LPLFLSLISSFFFPLSIALFITSHTFSFVSSCSQRYDTFGDCKCANWNWKKKIGIRFIASKKKKILQKKFINKLN